MSKQASTNVSPAVEEAVFQRLTKEAGGALLPLDLYCRTRKRVVASFCKVLSWDAVGGHLQAYYGRGVDQEEVRELRAADEARADGQGQNGDQDPEYIEAERTDGDRPEPLECILLTGAPMHLDMLHLEFKDFLLDSRSGARRYLLRRRGRV